MFGDEGDLDIRATLEAIVLAFIATPEVTTAFSRSVLRY
jgi:hypothetical protein